MRLSALAIALMLAGLASMAGAQSGDNIPEPPPPATSKIFVGTSFPNQVTVVNHLTDQVTGIIPIAHDPNSLASDPVRDIIYVSSRGRITAMHEMKEPPPMKEGESMWDYEARLPRYSSKRMVQYAIELKAGSIKKLKLEVGDLIELDRRKLVRMAR